MVSQKLSDRVQRDLRVLQAMVDGLEDYLKSPVLFWPLDERRVGKPLPRLTLGGFLYRLRRLRALAPYLSGSERVLLEEAESRLDELQRRFPEAFADKVRRELRSRLDSWQWFLDDCEEKGEECLVHYPHQVDARLKADLLLEIGQEMGLDLRKEQERLASLDERLREGFVQGDFVWDPALAEAFPRDAYWYLYGHFQPKSPQNH